jgi:hypothetical protein
MHPAQHLHQCLIDSAGYLAVVHWHHTSLEKALCHHDDATTCCSATGSVELFSAAQIEEV